MPVQVCTQPAGQNNLRLGFLEDREAPAPPGSGCRLDLRSRTGCFSLGDLLLLLSIQVSDQRVPFVDQYDQFVQQQLLSSLLGLSLLPVCNHRNISVELCP